MTRIVRASVAAAGITALVLAVAPVALAADHAVDIAGFAFSPGSITVKVGDTVTWSNADAQNHTATADDGSFDTGTVTSSTPKSVTFSTAGTFAYHCKIHPQMTATLVVEAASAPGTAKPTAPTTDAAIASASTASSTGSAWVIALVGLASAIGTGAWFARRRA